MDTESFSDSSTASTCVLSEADTWERQHAGHLYKTKLASLFLFRLVHDDNVEEFHLGKIEDNLIYKNFYFMIKHKEIKRPVIVVLHTAHYLDLFTAYARSWTLKRMCTLTNGIDKLLENSVKMCGRKFEDYDYLCVFYSYTRVGISKAKLKPYHRRFAAQLNTLLGTGDRQGLQLDCTGEELKEKHEEHLICEMDILAFYFAQYLDDQSMDIMQDRYIAQYHVLLAQRVVHVSDIQSQGLMKYRELTFRRDFFLTNDEYLIILGDKLCDFYNILHCTFDDDSLTSTVDSEEIIEEQISEFLSDPSATTLNPLIQKGVIHITRFYRLHFKVKRPRDDLQKLDVINCNTTEDDVMMKQARNIILTNILLSLKLKVPVTFGNKDLTLTGDSVEKHQIIDLIAQIIIKLCQRSIASGEYNIVLIDKHVEKGFLNIENGIGSAIGNVLVHDKDTELLKFTEDIECLQANARALYDKLKSSSIANNLNSYRFDAKTIKHFPILELDSLGDYKEDFNNHHVIFEQQGDYNEVEDILREEIERQFTDEQNVSVVSDKIFTYCHSAVQEWDMSYWQEDNDGEKKHRPLTKSGDVQCVQKKGTPLLRGERV